MDIRKAEPASPDLYLCTWKSMVLSMIKLAEAFFAGYVVILLLKGDATERFSGFFNLLSDRNAPGETSGLIETVSGNGFVGVKTDAMLFASLTARLLRYFKIVTESGTLSDVGRWITIACFTLVVADGLASFLLVWLRHGAGTVRAVHTARLAIAIITLIFTIYHIGDTIHILLETDGSDTAKLTRMLTGSFNVFHYFGYGSFFDFAVSALALTAVPAALIIWHWQVLKIISRIGPETAAGQMISGTYHSMPRVAAAMAGFYGIAAVTAIIHIAGSGTEIQGFLVYLGPILQRLFSGDGFADLAVIGVMILKFALISLCATDFDREHFKANTDAYRHRKSIN